MELKFILKEKTVKLENFTYRELQNHEDKQLKLCLEFWGAIALLNGKYWPIRRFYIRLPSDNEPLRLKLREESRSELLKRKSMLLLDTTELNALWVLLDTSQTTEDQLLNYADFQRVAELAGSKVRAYFKPSAFAKLQQGDMLGRVSALSLFNYVMRKVWFDQTRVGLSVYDSTGQGYLTATELENYIRDLLPTLRQLNGLEKSFHSFYLCTAVRKFMFFLDPIRANRVRILDVLASSFLDDLLELRDEELCKKVQEQNWFSAPSTLRIYGHYLNLDKNHNGMLSKEELTSYGTGTLTEPFLDRVFQTCLTYEGEMDYKTYLDLVLALENRSEPQALAFLFRILDIRGCGYLDAFTINYFFRAIQDQMRAHGSEQPVAFEDVKDELFDMVRPQNPDWITLQDLVNCGQGETFVNILIEYHRFWAYEHREAITSDPPSD